MKSSHRDLSEEITTLERRIHDRTLRVAEKVRETGTALQRSLTSPAVLLLAAGTGFAIGRLTDGSGMSEHVPGKPRAWLSSMFHAMKAAFSVVRTPAFLWLARLVGGQHETNNMYERVPPRSIPPTTR